MRSMYEQFGTSDSVEKEGVWIEFGSFRVRVARAGGANKAFSAALDKKTRPFARLIQTGLLEADKARELSIEAYAETVITGWQHRASADAPWQDGIPQRDGSSKPVSRESIIEAFLALPDLFNSVREHATDISIYRAEIRETSAKNL